MRKTLLTVVSAAVWAAIAVYLIVAGRMCSREMNSMRLQGVRVVVEDSARMGVVTQGMVRGWLDGVVATGMELRRINTVELQRSMLSRLFVRTARIYTNLRGELVVELAQRRPIARISTDNGYNFYITDDNYILPLQSHETLYVPVVTGVFTPPFGRGFVGEMKPLNECAGDGKKKLPENYIFISRLINFVKFIEGDDFWRSEIEQICLGGGAGEPVLEVVPRSGSHIAVLGTINDAERKMDKLLAFYRRALRYEGWESYSRIDLRYEGQVVCTK
jgi:cell division protein FtsQ